MKMSRTMPVMALIAGSLAVATVPASAAPLMATPNPVAAKANIEQVQYRHGWHGHRGYGYGPRGYYGHRHYHGGGWGAGAALGGLAAGAIIGGAIANSQAQAAQQNDAVAYCSQRFRSYDPASGTYIAKGGVRRSCP
ncbi:BA14K family protein [Rhodopseudomonas sp.]|uniref:BA14K family protein n=1 Tax=Rhodopseudomonas sp. TaxID=1078 RepID=UPI003B3BE321